MNFKRSPLKVFVKRYLLGIKMKVISIYIYPPKDAMLEFIREKALKLAQESKRKFSAQKKAKP